MSNKRTSSSTATRSPSGLAGPAISVEGLTKRYGDHVVVDELTFDIPRGVVTGFLGPNGSGKTTTLRMIFNLVHPTSGRAVVDGRPFGDHEAPATHAGVVVDGGAAHPKRTGRNHLRILAAERNVARTRVDEVLELVELTDAADRRVGGYSLGMRQRLDLASALLAEPKLLVLDEPANGLDPAGIRWLRTFLRAFALDGGTVFVSSHQLGELSQLADEVVVINRGVLIAHTRVDALVTSGAVAVGSRDLQVLEPALVHAGAQVQRADRDRLEVSGLTAEQVGQVAAENRAVLFELVSRSSSLEEVFIQMTQGEQS